MQFKMSKGELMKLIRDLPDDTEIYVAEQEADIYTGESHDIRGIVIDITNCCKAAVYLKI